MKIVCCYCQKAGRPCVIGEKAPFTSNAETHSVCPLCMAEQRAIVRAMDIKPAAALQAAA